MRGLAFCRNYVANSTRGVESSRNRLADFTRAVDIVKNILTLPGVFDSDLANVPVFAIVRLLVSFEH